MPGGLTEVVHASTREQGQPQSSAYSDARLTEERAGGLKANENRQNLLGHKSGRITSHYSAAELGNLIEAADKVAAQGSRKSPALVVPSKKAASA